VCEGGEWEELDMGEGMAGEGECIFKLDKLVVVGCAAGVECRCRRFYFLFTSLKAGLAVDVSE
jgi:hypothetical protein